MSSSLKSRRWRWIAIFTLFLVLMGAISIKAWRLYQLASDLRTQASHLAGYAEVERGTFDIPLLGQEVRTTYQTALDLQLELQPFNPLLSRLGWVPKLGPLLSSAGPAVDYAVGLTSAADQVVQIAAALLENPPDVDLSPGEQVLVLLEHKQENLQIARSSIETAIAARKDINIDALPSSLRDPLARIDPLLPLASQALDALKVLPTALGEDTPRTYLLLAQNNDELRASGGFITGVGTLTLDQGRIEDLTIGDSYAVDDLTQPYPPPPEPLQRFLNAGLWLLRDANWSPDFPTTAEQALSLYELSTGETAEGVVAFDQTAIQRLLATIGPVELPDFDEPIQSDNVIDYMHTAWGGGTGENEDSDWFRQRKDFMGLLGRAMLDKALAETEGDTLFALARSAFKLLREKHLLVYFTTPELQAPLHEAGLDGSLIAGEGDFLALIDTNLGFNKVDPFIERRIEYAVDLSEPGQPEARVRVIYTHTVPADIACEHGSFVRSPDYSNLQQRCYWDYFRIYTPDGVEEISGQAPAVPAEWLLTGEALSGEIRRVGAGPGGTVEFSGMLVLPTASTRSVEIAYHLPPGVLGTSQDGAYTYELKLFKQPGTHGVPVQITLVPPHGFKITANAAWIDDPAGSYIWQGRLFVDQDLRVQFSSIEDDE